MPDASVTIIDPGFVVYDGRSSVGVQTAGYLDVQPADDPIASTIEVALDPVSQSVDAGDTVTFTAAAGGHPLPSVQWQVSTDDGATWTNIGGATSPSYSFTAALDQDGYQFRAVFTNSAGSAATTAAILTVTAVAGLDFGHVGLPFSIWTAW